MPKTSRRITVRPLTLREVEVTHVQDLTPGMRRITLAGAQLGAFTSANGFAQPAFDSTGFDDDIRLVFRYPGQDRPVLPVQQAKGLDLPRDPRPLTRLYTVRRWAPETGELDVDVLKHGIGVGTTWAYRAQVGDRVHFFGPSSSRALPQDADWLLVAGDDSTIPAIARLLDELPEDARAQVFIEVAEDEHRQELRALPGVEVTWLVRAGSGDGTAAGTTRLLVDAVRNCAWWDGRPFAWIAGEQASVRDIRRHLVEDRGVAKQDIEFSGYWRRGEVVALETDGAVPDPAKTRTPMEKLHDLTELIAPLAIRTAVELDLPELISRGVTATADLAGKAGADERALGKLLRYLQTLDVLTETEPGHYDLTSVGEVLTVDFMADFLHPAGVAGREMLGIRGLTESIRTGRPAYASVAGQTYAEVRTEQDYEDRYLERLAKFQATLAEPIASSDILTGVRHLVLHSGGAGAQAREFVAAHPDLWITRCPRCPRRPTGCAATCPTPSPTSSSAPGSTSSSSPSSNPAPPPTPCSSSARSRTCPMPMPPMPCAEQPRTSSPAAGSCWSRTSSTPTTSTSTTVKPICSPSPCTARGCAPPPSSTPSSPEQGSNGACRTPSAGAPRSTN